MDKINKLLEEYKNIADKLNKINEAMNKYKIYMAQAKNVKKQLNELGYNKV